MKILDIDLDFFLSDIAYDVPFRSEKRLPSEYYQPWEEVQVRSFLEKNCGLSKASRIKGQIVKKHDGALHIWHKLIESDQLKFPFDVIHVDAHADLGLSMGDDAWTFIFNKVLSIEPELRKDFTEVFGEETFSKINSGNYLLFAIAYRWINNLRYVPHPSSAKDDFGQWIMMNNSKGSGFIQLKYFPEGVDVWKDIGKQTYVCEPEIKFDIVKNYEDLDLGSESPCDYLVLCQSPNYTPVESDAIMEIIKEYMIIE